jgi:hypothetical protein
MPQNIRSEKRYRVPERTYLHFKSDHEMVGRVLDVGAGGVGFEYVQLWDDDKNTTPASPMVVNILASGAHLLKEADCRLAYCYPVHSTSPFAGTVPMFRGGVQFQQLTDMQKSQLNAILLSCEEQSQHGARTAFDPPAFDMRACSRDTVVSV